MTAGAKSIVITGSTRGIGYGLADAFLDLGCSVSVSGREAASVERAVSALRASHAPANVLGVVCNVTNPNQLQALWEAATARFGRVDIWINNAGLAHPRRAFWEHSPQQVQAVVDANLTGAICGAIVALRGMRAQGFGSLYNMEGLGSTGRHVTGLALYGSTKSGLRYLTDALVQEVQGTAILVGALSPGMVLTDMLMQEYEGRPEDWNRAKRVFNILADRVETVTPWLARRALANRRNGARIRWLTQGKIAWRFLTAPFRGRDLFAEGTSPRH